MRITLLGPQRTPAVGAVARSLPAEGPIATVTAGWQEREPDDAELDRQLGSRSVNLSLYGRWLDVQERDPAFAAADRRLRQVLDEAQETYLLRLHHALAAVSALQRRGGNEQLRTEAVDEAVAAVRELDARHLDRVGDVRTEFHRAWPPQDRAVIAEHRAAVAGLLGRAVGLVLTGGHVGVLLDTLLLFDVAAAVHFPVVAWSAGAMALTDRIVLFHDRSPQGWGHPEVYADGLGLVRGVVPLPHARSRLRLDDAARMAVFARRFAPSRCVLLETGTRVETDADGTCPAGTRMLMADGRVSSMEAA